jgi:hypothetical protein
MGANMSNPIDEATQNRINERIQEVLKTFGVEFSKAYTQVVINKAKSDLEPSEDLESSLKLQCPPTPENIIKSGMLTKRGDKNKNWRNRFFVAYNAKDNFKVDYLDGTDEHGKLKGTIHCAGYYATEFNSDDVAEYGEKGIKLVPWSYRRRTWYIKCNDDELRKEWMSVFQNACYKAKPPHDENEVIAQSFDIALRNTRWACCIWGWYYGAGGEAERLGELVLDVLDQEILSEIIYKIPDGPSRSLTVDLIRKSISTTVHAATSAAWASAVSAMRAVSDKIESSCKDLIRPVIEKQQNLKEMIVEKISSTIDPFLADKGSALLTPVLRVLFNPVIRAFTAMAKGFHAHLTTAINNGDFHGSSDKFKSAWDRCDWQMDWWSGPIGDAYSITWRMYDSDLAEVASILASGSASMIYNMVNDKLKALVHRAVYTFGNLAASVAEGERLTMLAHTTGLLFHDCYIMVQSTIAAVLTYILSPMVNEMVLKPGQNAIAPLQEVVDSIPVPGLSVLLDLNALLEETVGDIVGNSINSIIKGSLAELRTSLDLARTEVGIAAVHL